MEAIINNQLVDVRLIKIKFGFFGKKYLVSYKHNVYDYGKFLYTINKTKWIKEKDIIK